MTITISSATETRLRDKAAREGGDPERLAEALLEAALDWEAEDAADEAAGIEQGLADFQAGRCRPFAEFAREQRAKYGISVES